MATFNLTDIATASVEARAKPTDADAKHQIMLEAIAPYAKAVSQKSASAVEIEYATRKSKLVLVLLPEWAPMFPPFNLARLSAVTKKAGYSTSIIDGNVRAHNAYRKVWEPQGLLPFKLWDPTGSWHWMEGQYDKHIHPLLEPILLQIVDEILTIGPSMVGFTMYYISEEPTKWMCAELKRRAPHIKIAVGGSNVQNGWFKSHPYYDYVVSGEGEEIILKILEEVENGVEHTETQIISQPEGQRLSINDLPLPDYTGIDFNQYEIPNGVNSEFSRGCIAKCTFCEETHFWKYRQRMAVDALAEVGHLYYEKGTDIFWFIDSLVNGNLNELRAFCKGIIAKEMKVRWTGYARCDGRMDLDYFKDLADSGCIMLNYGVESGSQRVLDDMAKGVTIKEMEDNFRDGKITGVAAATNWIIGFPTETPQNFAETMTFLWRIRNSNVNNIGAGVGFGQGPETIVGQNPDKFKMSHHKYRSHWITSDFAFGGMHVLTRVKSFTIFIDHLLTETPVDYPQRPNLKKYHYDVTFDDPTVENDIEYENFDYNIIKADINPFANSLVNEIFPLLRMMWRTRGGFTAEIRFTPELDLTEFGFQFGPGMLTANYKFTINHAGVWAADFTFLFNQNVNDPTDTREESRRGPFYAQDFSRIKSNTAHRARKLAKPVWGQDGRDGNDFTVLISDEERLNNTVDWSFEYDWQGVGDWGDYHQYAIAVPDKSVNEDASCTISSPTAHKVFKIQGS